MARQIGITFNIIGTCEQSIALNDRCPYTPEQVVQMLNDGDAVTSVGDGNAVVDLTNDAWDEIGIVVGSHVEGEYEDFQLEE